MSNPAALDTTFDRAIATTGYSYYEGLSNGDIQLGAGTTVVAATTNIVGVAAVGSGANVYRGFRWDAGADTGDILGFEKTMGPSFRVDAPSFHVHAEVRTVNLGTGSNSDLDLLGTARIHVPGQSAAIVLTGITPKLRTTRAAYVVGATAVANTGLNGFTEVYWDVGAALSAAQKLIIAGQKSDNGLIGVEFSWIPNEAVGTDLNIELIKPAIGYGTHANTRVDNKSRS